MTSNAASKELDIDYGVTLYWLLQTPNNTTQTMCRNWSISQLHPLSALNLLLFGQHISIPSR